MTFSSTVQPNSSSITIYRLFTSPISLSSSSIPRSFRNRLKILFNQREELLCRVEYLTADGLELYLQATTKASKAQLAMSSARNLSFCRELSCPHTRTNLLLSFFRADKAFADGSVDFKTLKEPDSRVAKSHFSFSGRDAVRAQGLWTRKYLARLEMAAFIAKQLCLRHLESLESHSQRFSCKRQHGRSSSLFPSLAMSPLGWLGHETPRWCHF